MLFSCVFKFTFQNVIYTGFTQVFKNICKMFLATWFVVQVEIKTKEKKYTVHNYNIGVEGDMTYFYRRSDWVLFHYCWCLI